jgi:tRNA threonylcarbamoyl adenosine modification protein (Sua5/YciO/YrdC/YwlC family)
MRLELHPDNPQTRHIKAITECLLQGGVIVYPTDTLYGLGCDILQRQAIERISLLKNKDPAQMQLSFICAGLSDLSKYCKSISTPVYRLLKTHLPGPFTFILPASKQVPKILKSRKNTIGLRIPGNRIALEIVKVLGHPLLSVSLPGERIDEIADPVRIHEIFEKRVDIVVDGGIGGTIPSTIIDCTGDSPVLVRRGAGKWEDG